MAKNTVHVPLDWHRISWMPDDKWKADILGKLKTVGVLPGHLKRCVYVIRLNGDFCIQYPKGQSPTIYIGEGRFGARILQHAKWVKPIENLVGKFSFQVCLAFPRVRKNEYAYRDAEAALLSYFGKKYGTTPLWNKQYETRTNPNYVYNEKSISEALNKRRGAKYHWAIKPMPSSPFHRCFMQPPK